MREIKFRAYDKNKKVMHEDIQLWAENALWQYFGVETFGELLNQPHVEIMQFTGLLDKNGKEIFENDLMEIYYSDCPNGFTRLDGKREFIMIVGIVEFKEGEWVVTHREPENKEIRRPRLFYMLQNNNRCVVGNAYENPELLETK